MVARRKCPLSIARLYGRRSGVKHLIPRASHRASRRPFATGRIAVVAYAAAAVDDPRELLGGHLCVAGTAACSRAPRARRMRPGRRCPSRRCRRSTAGRAVESTSPEPSARTSTRPPRSPRRRHRPSRTRQRLPGAVRRLRRRRCPRRTRSWSNVMRSVPSAHVGAHVVDHLLARGDLHRCGPLMRSWTSTDPWLSMRVKLAMSRQLRSWARSVVAEAQPAIATPPNTHRNEESMHGTQAMCEAARSAVMADPLRNGGNRLSRRWGWP